MNHALRRLLARLEITGSGYLHAIGWFDTRAARLARDVLGNPMPWFTYPAAAFLAERVRADWRVLEFGAGMGTAWWSSNVDACIAIEHDPGWAARVATLTAAQVLIAGAENAAAYCAPARGLGLFDVVVVDGLFRDECLRLAPELLSAGGVIVLDDAQRPEYAAAVDDLRTGGMRWLPFHGPQPVSKHAGCTALLYRDGNVLGI